MRLMKQKLGQAVPVAGVVIGAGLNGRLLAKVVTDADRLCRERFLREAYDLPAPSLGTAIIPPAPKVAETITIVDLVEREPDAEEDDSGGGY